MLRILAISALALGVLAPAAFASCDISQTKCALNGGKCNIHFKNRTGDTRGSGVGTALRQESFAHTVRVKALKDNGNKAGNSMTIEVNATNTMNLDKKAKKNFANIKLVSLAVVGVKNTTIGCDQIKRVLDGNGTCKIFYGEGKYANGDDDRRQLGYSCDGGNVVGPKW